MQDRGGRVEFVTRASSSNVDTLRWDYLACVTGFDDQRPRGHLDRVRLRIFSPTGAVVAHVSVADRRQTKFITTNDGRRLQTPVPDLADLAFGPYLFGRERVPTTPAQLLCDDEGNIRGATASAAPWLSIPWIRSALPLRVEAVRRGERLGEAMFLASCRTMRLESLDGVPPLTLLTLSNMTSSEYTSPFAGLTVRQREIAEHRADGRSVLEIADVLGTSKETIKSHLRAISERLGSSAAVDLARWRDEEE